MKRALVSSLCYIFCRLNFLNDSYFFLYDLVPYLLFLWLIDLLMSISPYLPLRVCRPQQSARLEQRTQPRLLLLSYLQAVGGCGKVMVEHFHTPCVRFVVDTPRGRKWESVV